MRKKPSDEDRRILAALAWMCQQYLADSSGGLDNMCMSAGEDALSILAEYGYADYDPGGRFGAWTAAGDALLDEQF